MTLGTTLIDLALEIANEDHSAFIAIVRELKEKLALNIEEASPADFIPLPAGYRERGQYVGRYGQLDVFHFDVYSTALSKIERGNENDFADVLALLQTDRLEMSKLEQYFAEILLRYATESLKQDPIEFQRKFAALVDLWRDLSKTN